MINTVEMKKKKKNGGNKTTWLYNKGLQTLAYPNN